MSITAPISLRKGIIVIFSLNAVDNAMCYASIVGKAISVCSLDFQMMGHRACFVINLVLECADLGSSAFGELKPSAKSVSANTSKPLSMLGSRINSSLPVPSKNFPILFTDAP